ncbi:MAG: TetR family transcriptional regulator [Microlunatus sp.]
MSDRRTQIAEAGIRILASRGVRALTHRAIDDTLGLAAGSTSYYARTRRDLIALIVDRLAERTTGDLAAQQIPEAPTPQILASMLVAALDATMARADDHRARLILLLECRDDPELHTSLATRPEVRSAIVEVTTTLLAKLGVDEPHAYAGDLAGLLDGLLMQRIIRTAPIDEERVITAYLTGLPKGQRPVAEG